MNVGDYVRTENGIDKVAGYRYEPEYENGHVVWFEKSGSGCRFTDKDLPKTSPNIIDLIEVGDYVNGVRVEEVLKKEDLCFIYLENGFDDVDNDYVLENGIVTKEQFSQMEYKIQ